MSGTETFNYTATYNNGFYEFVLSASPNVVFEIPVAEARFQVHSSLANLFYVGDFNPVLLDYTKCTNQTPTSRQNLIEILVGLATPPSTVTVSGGTLTTVGTVNTVTTVGSVTTLPPITIASVPIASSIGPMYALSFTGSSSSNLVALKVNSPGNYMVLASLICSSSLALSSGLNVSILFNPTVTGGTFATPASIAGSIVQSNTTFTSVTGGTTMFIAPFNTSTNLLNLLSYNRQITNGQIIVIVLTQTGIGSSTIAINWTENV